ncbi:3'-5' exonuclease [Shewanella sp.]|uniref:3'-5' exonuclease n=1 Tax=Shewanella sp. TaxID=50422 RepID=UPI003565AE4B
MNTQSNTEQQKVKALLANCHILDTETTGLHHAEVVEISIIDQSGNVVFDSLIKPVNPIPADATSIHGITDEMVKDAPSWGDVHDQICALLLAKPLVIFNAAYDVQVMQETAEKYGKNIPEQFTQDSLNHGAFCAMKSYAEFYGVWDDTRQQYKWQSLAKAAAQQNVTIEGQAHRALADCRTTLGVINAMAKGA